MSLLATFSLLFVCGSEDSEKRPTSLIIKLKPNTRRSKKVSCEPHTHEEETSEEISDIIETSLLKRGFNKECYDICLKGADPKTDIISEACVGCREANFEKNGNRFNGSAKTRNFKEQ